MLSDICLILEGTFPYVSGGVASWVYNLIKEFPDLTFSILYLGPHRSATKEIKYPIPENVVDLRGYYLFDYLVKKERGSRKDSDGFKRISRFMADVQELKTESFDDVYSLVGDYNTRSVSLYDLVYSQEAWNLIRELYSREEEKTSFIDYFWTWRFIYLPFFSLMRINLPQAKVYHAPSTGYAGVIGSMCKLKYNRPLILTEHGIYTRERKIEIARADWIYSASAKEIKVIERKDIFREWWINLFSYFSSLTYERADEIITLFEGNRTIQIAEGADPEKISIVPNGIELLEEPAAKSVDHGAKKRIGFVGRVVPIKDIKTFITACRKVRDVLKDIDVVILGPTDEDEEYFKECELVTEVQAMDDVITFMGWDNPAKYYENFDVVVLTSISEAQPLVVLEAQAYKIPVVATEVGSCPELLYGSSPDDTLLGKSGIIAQIGDPEGIAKAIIKILTSPELKQKMGEVGRKRVESYYQIDDLVASYHTVYSRYLNQVRW